MSTKSDLESARAYLARMAQASAFSRETTEAIEILLAATAEPNGDELAAEAARFANEVCCFRSGGLDVERAKDALSRKPASMHWGDSVRAYIAGARREGLR